MKFEIYTSRKLSKPKTTPEMIAYLCITAYQNGQTLKQIGKELERVYREAKKIRAKKGKR